MPAGRRNRAVLLLLFNTGARASELAGLKTADVIRDRPQHVRILGKGRRWRAVPLWARTLTAIDEMLRDRAAENPALFLGQRGESLTRYGVLYIVRQHARLAAERLPSMQRKRLSPHTVRHTTAVALLRATGDIDAVSKVLGHASLNTTRIYTARDQTRVAATVESIARDVLPRRRALWPPSDDVIAWLERL